MQKPPMSASYDKGSVRAEEVSVAGGGARKTIAPPHSASNLSVRLAKGKSVVAVSNLLSNDEIQYLAQSSKEAASGQTSNETDNGRVCVRMPTAAAADRRDVPDAGTDDLHDPLPLEVSRYLEERILRRTMAYIDDNIPDVPNTLFGTDSLEKLFVDGELEWSTREPAVNVYYPPGGHFGIHKDQKSLTILMPLSSPGRDFTGGGTAFWSQSHPDERRHAPSLTMVPEAGTALLFGGCVSHKGLRIESGVRVVFVASFSRRPKKQKSATWLVSAR